MKSPLTLEVKVTPRYLYWETNYSRFTPFRDRLMQQGTLLQDSDIHYHAKTQKLIGLAMSTNELGSLHDVFKTL